MPGKRRRGPSREVEALRERLREAEETLSAIRSGEVDSILVEGAGGPRVYALEGSTAVYRELIDGMSEGAVSLNREGVVTYCNRRFGELVGRPLEQVTGTAFLDLVSPEHRSEADGFLREGWKAGARTETELPSGGPQPRAVLVSATPVQDGQPLLCLVVTDLTERVAVEKALAASERRYRALLDLSPEAIWVARDGRIETANRSAAILGGLASPGDLIGRSPLDFIAPADVAATLERMARTLAGEEVGATDLRVVRADGQVREVEAIGCLLEDERGKAIVADIRDVTERRALERRLAEVLDASANGFWERDLRTGIVLHSARMNELLGLPAVDRTAGSTELVDAMHPDDRARLGSLYEAVFAGREPAFDVEFRLRHASGAWRWFRSRGKVVQRDETGSPLRVSGILMDVQDRKEMEDALRGREARLEAYFNTSAVGIAVTNPQKAWVEVNQTFCEMLGYSREELRELTWAQVTHPDDVDLDVREFERILAGETEGYSIDKRYIRKDGTILWVLLAVSCIRRPDRAVECVVAVARDIGARKGAETELRESREALRIQQEHLDLAANSGKLGLWDLDLETNQAWRTLQHDRLFGYDELQPTWGPPDAERHVVPEDVPVFRRAFEEAFATGRFHYELRIRPAGQPLRWLEASGEVIRDDSGKPVRMRGAVADVTDRKLAEERLAEASSYARRLIEASLDPLVTISPDGKITDVNRATEEATGFPRDRLVGTDFADYFTEPGSARAGYEKVLAAGEVRDYPLVLRHASGRTIDVVYNATLYADAKGRTLGVFAAARDVSDRKRAEEALRASEAKFRTLADEAPIGIYQTDGNGRNVYLNRTAQGIVGQTPEEARATGWHGSLHPDDRDRVVREFADAIATGTVFESEYRFLHRDGTSVLARGHATALRDGAGSIIGYIGVVMDVTALKALEAQLALASRLAAMGTLVAGVAHEVNNPLTATLADAGLAREAIQELRARLRGGQALDREKEAQVLDDVLDELDDAQEGGRRIERIVKDLSAFGRQGAERVRLRLLDVVNQAMRWLPASVGHVAVVKVEDGGAPDVLAAFGQIEQVVVNLVTNAAKATKPGAPGSIIVRIGPGPPGKARLDVTDSGVGIPPDIRDRIFDPFFTTRQTGEGRGTGLGLAVSHTIVSNHGGTLTVQSEVGKGSTFRMELPAAPPEA